MRPDFQEPDIADLYTEDGRAIVTRRPRHFGLLAIATGLVIVGGLAFHEWSRPSVNISLEAMSGSGHESAPVVETHVDPEPDLLEAIVVSEEANYSGEAEVLPTPRPGDWLYEFPEQGQTYRQYLVQATNRRTSSRFVLYIMPLGPLTDHGQKVVDLTSDYVGAFFGAPTRVLPPISLPINAFEPTRNQYDANHVLSRLRHELPKDALGLLAITDADLFVPGVNWVFGLGSARHRVSVFSLRRYGNDQRLTGADGTILRRSLLTATHELGHVMSMRHCTAFRCIMNGTNTLAEADAHPMNLCPVCYKKAQHGLAFDPTRRYERLAAFYDKYRFDGEEAFVRRRLDPPPADATELVEFVDGLGPQVITAGQ